MRTEKLCNDLNLGIVATSYVTDAVTHYSRDFSLGLILPLISNFFRSIFGLSDWQQASKALENRSIKLLSDNFSEPHLSELKTKAHLISNYILNNLIISKTKEIGHSHPNQALSFDVDTIMERAVYGNGYTLGQTPKAGFISMITKNIEKMDALCNSFSNFLANRKKSISMLTKKHFPTLVKSASDLLQKSKQATKISKNINLSEMNLKSLKQLKVDSKELLIEITKVMEDAKKFMI